MQSTMNLSNGNITEDTFEVVRIEPKLASMETFYSFSVLDGNGNRMTVYIGESDVDNAVAALMTAFEKARIN